MRYPIALKKVVHNSKYIVKNAFTNNALYLDWCKGFNNFGDILNPILVNYISEKNIINVNSRYCLSENMLAIGSILDRATKYSIVWGSGYISSKSHVLSTPKKIHAVRGPFTRKLLLEQGIECPEVYGDPALLMPKFYKPTVASKYELGIIPHYSDKHAPFLKSLAAQGVLIIDIQNPNPLKVVDQLLSCKHIASSSLHGLIIPEAYGIPTLWLNISGTLTGDKFKFKDYYASIGEELPIRYQLEENTSKEFLIANTTLKSMDIDLDKLLKSFPEELI